MGAPVVAHAAGIILSLWLLSVPCEAQPRWAPAPAFSVLVGFFSASPMELWTLNGSSGALTRIAAYDVGEHTAWMEVSPDQAAVYASATTPDGAGVAILGTQVDGSTGLVTRLVPSGFAALAPPSNVVHMTLRGGALYTVSYSDGSFSGFAVAPRGQPGSGSAANLTLVSSRMPLCRNAHQIVVAPTGDPTTDTVLVPCLGDDALLPGVTGTRCASGGTGTICLAGSPAGAAPGAGPRHVVVHPRGLPVAYSLNELDSTLTTWTYDDGVARGRVPALRNPTTISSLPPGTPFAGNASYWAGGEVAVNSAGSVVYVSNRSLRRSVGGNCSIGGFRVDRATGAIVGPIGWYTAGGEVAFPRHFSLSPDERWLLVGNQRGNSITVFAVLGDGTLRRAATVATPGSQPAFVLALPNLVTGTGKVVANGSPPGASAALGLGLGGHGQGLHANVLVGATALFAAVAGLALRTGRG